MKNTIVILLLSLFLFHTVGLTVLLEGLDQINRSMITSSLEEKRLDDFVLDVSTYLHCVKEGKEISFNGNRYDIVSVQIVHDKVFIKCFHDENEESLLSILAEHIEKSIKNTGAHSKNKSSRILKSLIKNYLPANTVYSKPYIASISDNYLYQATTKQLWGYAEILAPPPKS